MATPCDIFSSSGWLCWCLSRWLARDQWDNSEASGHSSVSVWTSLIIISLLSVHWFVSHTHAMPCSRRSLSKLHSVGNRIVIYMFPCFAIPFNSHANFNAIVLSMKYLFIMSNWLLYTGKSEDYGHHRPRIVSFHDGTGAGSGWRHRRCSSHLRVDAFWDHILQSELIQLEWLFRYCVKCMSLCVSSALRVSSRSSHSGAARTGWGVSG